MDVKLRKVLLTTLSALSVAAISGAASSQTAPSIESGGFVSNILDGAAPGTVTVAGITVYGTIDVGAVYNDHEGRSVGGSFYPGATYLVSNFSNRSSFTYQNNAMSQSLLGVKGTQSLRELSGLDGLKGWSVGFDLQVGIDPLSGSLADVCKTLTQNNGFAQSSGSPQKQRGTDAAETANLDGSRCGQLFNGEAYGSLKNDILGELRFGRNNSLLLTSLSDYDSQAGSYAYSLFAFSGTYGGGSGTTELARWNNSLKYTNTIGIVRVAAAYRFDGGDQGGDGYSFRAGVDVPGALKGLSFDGVYSKENSAISAGALTGIDGASGVYGGQCKAAGFTTAQACQSSNVLSGTVSDNESWAFMAKYKFDGAQVMGGYEHIALNNPSSTLSNTNTIGGYQLLNLPGTANGINYTRYASERDLDLYWIGGKYNFTPKLTGSAAWYHVDQNSFNAFKAGGTSNVGCTGGAPNIGPKGTNGYSSCSGSLNFYSTTLDYQVTKRLDYYAGVTWSDVSGGLSSGFLRTNDYALSSGVRFRF